MGNSTDLDETRRLLYGALVADKTARWELVGTLVNALTHHSGLVEDPYEALDKLVDLVQDYGPERDEAARDWAKSLIARVTGSMAPPAVEPDGGPEGTQ